MKLLVPFSAIIFIIGITAYTLNTDAIPLPPPEDLVDDSFDDLKNDIDELVDSGDLNSRFARTLLRLCDRAGDLADSGNEEGAIKLLERFNIIVQRLVDGGRLSVDGGQLLIGSANNSINAIIFHLGFVPGQVLVTFKFDAMESEILALIAECQTNIIFDSNSEIEKALNDPGAIIDELSPQDKMLIKQFYWLEINSNQSLAVTIACFESRTDIVELVSSNAVFAIGNHRLPSHPNDLQQQQWSLLNAGQAEPPAALGSDNPGGRFGSIDADIDVIQAWDLPHRDCRKANVAIFDTGADFTHPDLAPNLSALSFNNVPPIGGIPTDTNGHGTHVAGIIGAVGNNGMNIAGICWQANLMIFRVGPGPGILLGSVVTGTVQIFILETIFGIDVPIVNASWGATPGLLTANQIAQMGTFVGINNALGNLVITGAGNNNANIDSVAAGNPGFLPCSNPAPNVICLAASNNQDELAGGPANPAENADSNFGPISVDLAAPGENILSLHPIPLGLGPTNVFSGTSMAAPHVSGVAALSLSLFPGKTPLQVKNDILSGSVGFPVASGVDIIKTADPNTLVGKVVSDGRLRFPYTGDLGDAPQTYFTIASAGPPGALHWDTGNEFLGNDVTPEVDANTPPPLDQDPLANLAPVNTDGADEPIGPGNGGFVFAPQPPWPSPTPLNAPIQVKYQVCSDHLGINDADNGRYQGGNPDRAIYVNAWFDLDNSGFFDFTELLLQDIISVPPVPGVPLNKLLNYPNVQVNQHAVLPAPGANPLVFPPVTICIPITSFFHIPAGLPGEMVTPDWYRFRLDYAEDINENPTETPLLDGPEPLFKEDQNAPIPPVGAQGDHYWLRHGEVEDNKLFEIDEYANSRAQLNLMTPFGPISLTLNGPTTIVVDIGGVADTDSNNREQVSTEMVQLELTGSDPIIGQVNVRLSPTQKTLGEIEETVNTQTERLDLPPFAPSGMADSFFDVFFEVEIPSLGLLLHNNDPKHMETVIKHKPPGKDETYQNPDLIELFNPDDSPSGVFLGTTTHTPDPSETELKIVKETVGRDETFTFNSAELGNFDIATAGGSGEMTFNNLPPGIVSVTEMVPNGWILVSKTCDNGDVPSSITLNSGDKVVCTFVDRELEIDFFPNSLGELQILTPIGAVDLQATGPTTIHVDHLNPHDMDGNSLDQVDTEIVSMSLTGFHPMLGQVDVTVSSVRPTIGVIEELVNNTPGVLDLPPFAATGAANSFFDVFFEITVEAFPGQTFHNEEPKRMEVVITFKPPAQGESYFNPDVIPLFDQDNNPAGLSIGIARHTPDPFPGEDLICDVTSEVVFDPSGHFEFIGPLPDTLNLSMTDGQISMAGAFPWVDVAGPIDEFGRIAATGMGTVAGFPDTLVEFNGSHLPDHLLSGQYEMGAGGGLPGGDPIIFQVDGLCQTSNNSGPIS